MSKIVKADVLKKELDQIYETDKKKLRTNTVLYGHLGEGRWHTHIQPGLVLKAIVDYETKTKVHFPSVYKEFLRNCNGCYLFDILRVSGIGPETYRGLSYEEQVHQAFDLEVMQDLYRRKGTPENHFIFADSLVKNTYYVIDMLNENILEIEYRSKKILKSYKNLEIFFREVILEGKNNIANRIFYEFE